MYLPFDKSPIWFCSIVTLEDYNQKDCSCVLQWSRKDYDTKASGCNGKETGLRIFVYSITNIYKNM